MLNSFRKKSILRFLELFSGSPATPMDLLLNNFYRANKSLGSSDRRYIGDMIYAIVRNLSLLDAHLPSPALWEDRVNLFLEKNLKTLERSPHLAPYQKASLSEDIYTLLLNFYGEEQTKVLSEILNTPAPTTVRVNLLKTTRDLILRGWNDRYEITPCRESSSGIVFNKKIDLPSLSEFKKGLFEIQDEGSQLISELVKATPGESVLDFCAGGGGKSLAIAPKMDGKGQIFLHDIRKTPLISAKKRLKRAGVQNAQIIFEEPKKLSKLSRKMDWVLIDVPCSGSGTWRRNPDQKWKFSKATLERLVAEQRKIFDQALTYLKPNGHVVYATCSLFSQENEEQVEYFLKHYPVQLSAPLFKRLPVSGGMDGFFGAVFSFSLEKEKTF
jgi:16S rRNA (cytosine967-C5)-methyltransferase